MEAEVFLYHKYNLIFDPHEPSVHVTLTQVLTLTTAYSNSNPKLKSTPAVNPVLK